MEIVSEPKNVIPSKLDLQPPSLLNEKYFEVCLFFSGYVTTSKKSEKNRANWCTLFSRCMNFFRFFDQLYTKKKNKTQKKRILRIAEEGKG